MHPTDLQPVALPFGGDTFYVLPDLDLMLEIEDELGSLPRLYRKFQGHDWQASEAITIIQIMLARAGHAIDWKELGQKLLAQGIEHSKKPVLDLLCPPMTGTSLHTAQA